MYTDRSLEKEMAAIAETLRDVTVENNSYTLDRMIVGDDIVALNLGSNLRCRPNLLDRGLESARGCLAPRHVALISLITLINLITLIILITLVTRTTRIDVCSRAERTSWRPSTRVCMFASVMGACVCMEGICNSSCSTSFFDRGSVGGRTNKALFGCLSV